MDMATPPSHAKPTLETWDWLYEHEKDEWTTPIISDVAAKVFDEMTEGKTGLDLFAPMCGRSPDLLWLAEQGHRVTGIEWSEKAVKQFFQDNSLKYTTETCSVGQTEGIPIYRGVDVPITIYCGDFFSFRGHPIGTFDCIWDHGSVGSFPPEESQRADYVAVCDSMLKPGGKILLSAFDYEHSEHPSMPFTCTEHGVHEMYGDRYKIQLVLQLDKDKTMEKLGRSPGDYIFPIWKFTRFSWNFYILTKK